MKNTVTESLIRYLKSSLSSKFPAKEIDFIRDYYHRLSGQDYHHKIAIELYNLAFEHKKIGRTKRPDETKLRLQNISPSEHDQQGKTVVFVVSDNKPFLVNSLLMRLNDLSKTPIRMLHPTFGVIRNNKNQILDIRRNSRSSNKQDLTSVIYESYIQLVIPFTPRSQHGEFSHCLQEVLDAVGYVVDDYRPMRNKVITHAETLKQLSALPIFSEYPALFRWMTEDNFAFLGYCQVKLDTHSGKITLNTSSLMGCIKAQKGKQQEIIDHVLPPVRLLRTSPITFTKTRCRSKVHRNNYMDCILFSADFARSTKVIDVYCIVGFLAGSTANLPTHAIPHLRNKIKYVIETSTLRHGGYAYKELRGILETLPRDKLFQMDIKSLYGLSMTLLNQTKRKTRLHIHENVCGHFYSCLVYVPKDLFNSDLRETIMAFLSDFFNASEVEFEVYFAPGILTRIHFIIHTTGNKKVSYKIAELEKAVQKIALDWDQLLTEICYEKHGQKQTLEILKQFNKSFPIAYRNKYDIKTAAEDIAIWLNLNPGQIDSRLLPIASTIYKDLASFKIYGCRIGIALSDILPIFENMGMHVLSEQPYEIQTTDDKSFFLLDFKVKRKDNKAFDLRTDSALLEDSFIHCWNGALENDGFNQLTLMSGLSWREVSMVRAYFRYLKQIRLRYSEHYIIDALCHYPELLKTIYSYFHSLFTPYKNRLGIRKFQQEIKTYIEKIATIDEERIIGALLDVINATLRTNFFQLDEHGQYKNYISIKLKSNFIPRIPQPAPKYEIFVYSPKIEGVHLRGRKVARGGIRWSDRNEDFRTEILGLVKAQKVKNALIVPGGSKGGFVAKQPPANDSRRAIMEQGIDCYQTYIRGLLDITDNLAGDKVIRPDNVIALDDDDPYLVVAADKGTATFSDYANVISSQYDFWLGDAFASGGSEGYDHKKMGITARGAWESVKRHFREKGKDIQSQPFTVVGIGDMSGDVFGNGMLISKQTKLVAAFNHLHIFIDPNPDIDHSYQERNRLFKLSRSSWNDYNKSLISKGGGIFSRSEKSIHLPPQARKMLQASKDKYTPNKLIQLILKAPVELLWNGGIGTYVKSSSETHADAQDRNSEDVRVNADELRCQVIGEGGNLGLTQLARIEFSHFNGACYTDAIDNSAGVDTSDHEVNIKILLNTEVKNKKLSLAKRNNILQSMERDVASLVLVNNYEQTQTVSIEAIFGHELMPQHIRAIRQLEDQSLLNRDMEFLDTHKKLKERWEAKKFLTRPELSILLSYCKMDLYQKLLDSTLPESGFLSTVLINYFPKKIHKNYKNQILKHQLKREIISTMVTNKLVSTMGPCFILNMIDLTGAKAEHIISCSIATMNVLEVDEIISAIKKLDNKVDAKAQMLCLKQIRDIIQVSVIWLLNNTYSSFNIGSMIDQYEKQYTILIKQKNKFSGTKAALIAQQQKKQLLAEKIPNMVTEKLVTLQFFSHGLDIIHGANSCNQSVITMAWLYFKVNDTLRTGWIYEEMSKFNIGSIWHEKIKSSLAYDLRQKVLGISIKITKIEANTPSKKFSLWLNKHKSLVNDFTQSVTNAQRSGNIEPIVLSVLVNELNKLS